STAAASPAPSIRTSSSTTSQLRGRLRPSVSRTVMSPLGFDHGAGHPRLFLDDAKAPNCRKNNGFGDLGNYSDWPKVAGSVIHAENTLPKPQTTQGIEGCDISDMRMTVRHDGANECI